MAANIDPIFTVTPKIGHGDIPTAFANVKSDGAIVIGTDGVLAFSAGANGSYIQRVRFSINGSAAAVTSVATTLRIFLSTIASGTATAATAFLLAEISVPAISASHSTNATNYYDVPLNIAIPAGYNVLVTQHLAQTANSNWQALVIGGDY